MTSTRFGRRDLAVFIRAFGENQQITHTDLELLWAEFVGVDPQMPDGNKLSRATALITQLAASSEADRELVDLVNQAYYFSHQSGWRRQDDAFKPLLVRLYEKNFTIHEDKGLVPPSDKPATGLGARPEVYSTAALPIVRPSTRITTDRRDMTPAKDDRAVFVVHGRNLEVKNELVKFLKHIDAKPISWEQAAAATKKPRPYTLDIIEAGMAMAQAIVVIFSPDDEAKLKDRFIKAGDGAQERTVTGQARQNVTLEAGMAMAMAPDSTVFVRIGQPRDISDILGINWIDLDDTWSSRKRLVSALEAAHVKVEATVDLTATDSGKFTGVPL